MLIARVNDTTNSVNQDLFVAALVGPQNGPREAPRQLQESARRTPENQSESALIMSESALRARQGQQRVEQAESSKNAHPRNLFAGLSEP
jgi:hypothetical protein